jgi:hypothetical protein
MKSVSLLATAVISAALMTACSSKHEDAQSPAKKKTKAAEVETVSIDKALLGYWNSECVNSGPVDGNVGSSSRTQLYVFSSELLSFNDQVFAGHGCQGTPIKQTEDRFIYDLSQQTDTQAQFQLSEYKEETGRRDSMYYRGKKVQVWTVKIVDGKLNLIGLPAEGDTTPTQYTKAE